MHAASGWSYHEAILNWDNLIDDFEGGMFAPAFYWGGGAAGANLGIWQDATITSWGPTTGKALLYGAGTLTERVNATADAFFAVAPSVIKLTANAFATMGTSARGYLVSRGKSPNYCSMAMYEANHHLQLHNIGGNWPDTASAYNAALAYNINVPVLWTDNQVYIASQAVPAGTTPANGAYWTLYLTAVQIAEQASQAFYSKIMNDPRFGDMNTLYLDGIEHTGGWIFWYMRIAPTISIDGFWAVLTSEGDTDTSGGPSTNWRYKALVDFNTYLKNKVAA
jgi:hypothetical protein